MTYTISATRLLSAPPRRIYDIIANYHTGHPKIVPDQFSNLRVERGGIGAGTVITFDVTVLGRTTAFRAEVSEPEPGRMLVERNVAGSDSITTFIVEPGAHPNEAVVTIKTDMTYRSGLSGAIERFVTKQVLRPMYDEELRRLESVAADHHETATSATVRA
jgi:Polyketide cyclase / dehydrase and lipid transport